MSIIWSDSDDSHTVTVGSKTFKIRSINFPIAWTIEQCNDAINNAAIIIFGDINYVFQIHIFEKPTVSDPDIELRYLIMIAHENVGIPSGWPFNMPPFPVS